MFDNLEVLIQGEVCPAWLRLDNPDNDDAFSKLRREDPTSSEEMKFMPVVFSQVEESFIQWYGCYGRVRREQRISHRIVDVSTFHYRLWT